MSKKESNSISFKTAKDLENWWTYFKPKVEEVAVEHSYKLKPKSFSMRAVWPGFLDFYLTDFSEDIPQGLRDIIINLFEASNSKS